MKDSATDATESARFVVENERGSETDGMTWNVRCRDWTEAPRLEVRGFGHGIRAVTDAIYPACNLTGSPTRLELMAWLRVS